MNDSPELKGIASVKYNTAYNEVEDNLISFFDWGLLNKDNFFNVQRNQTVSSLINQYGPEPFDFYTKKDVKLSTDASLMSPLNNQAIPKGLIWYGLHDNWVWESGVSVASEVSEPIKVSGIYVNNVFYPSGVTGQYEHFIDYNNGQVVFKNPIALTSKVQVEHSFKWISVRGSDVLESIRNIGDEVSEFDYRMPLICIDSPERKQSGLQLGGGQILHFDVFFYCFASTDDMCERLMDIISFQNDRTIYFYNKNFMILDDGFPFLNNGKLRQNAKNYRELIVSYPGYKAQSYNTSSIKSNFKRAFFKSGVVRMMLDLRKYNI